MILDKADDFPVIFFVDRKNKADQIKLICKDKKVACFFIKEDRQLRQVRACLKHLDRCELVALDKFGRGADLRFNKDSQVVTAFTP